MLFRGELITLQRWISALPEERIQASARICVYAAWVNLLTGQVQALADRLQQAERLLAVAPVEDLAGHVAAIRAYATAQQGDVERTVELARHALDLLAEDSLGVRGVVWFILGATSILRGDLAGAEEALLQASTTGQQGGNIHIAVPALNALSGLQAQRGRLHRAQATAQEAIRIASGDTDQPLPIAGGAVSALAELAYEWDDLDEALALAQQSLDLNQQWGNSDSLYSCYLTLAQVLQARGDPAGAEEALREAEALSRERSLSPLHKTAWHAVRARIWLAQGKLDAVARWAQDTTFEGPEQLRAAEHLALARARLVLVQPAAALQVLNPLLEMSRNLGMTTLAIEALAVEALAHQALGDGDRALRALAEALALARPEGYVRRFLDQGGALAPLLRAAWSRDIERAYVAELLAAFEERTIDEAEASIRRPTIDDGPAVGHLSFLVEPLSERELEVLDLIAAGLSNREIAEKMIVEVSTVKSHANHIYGKLGVKNRTQAVARARELGLL
jgi:LuxR family maltose regulon positive regulatory protein